MELSCTDDISQRKDDSKHFSFERAKNFRELDLREMIGLSLLRGLSCPSRSLVRNVDLGREMYVYN